MRIVRFKDFIRFNGKGLMLCLPFDLYFIIAMPTRFITSVSK